MKYVKAESVLPQSLVEEIQKYVQGKTLYIPKTKAEHRKWGSRSGTRKIIDERNTEIKAAFSRGKTVNELAAEYYLSSETIKKIVYKKR
ncbi:CD3324 family protein [Rossellomorea arthrocnemi]|jgi:Mor family transcriptional regulator|uniref:CD3324 family protein n=1 Tax=Rossellomorea arthrocnemi TaxID=2769542 RepID=UPI001E44B88E